MTRIPEKLFGIIGYPLGHTLSPRIHNWGFERFGLPYAYMAWPTPPEDLGRMAGAVRAMGIAGMSVTIPHKTAIMEYLDGVSELGRAVGAVNTLYWRDGKLLGENTDVSGVMRPLRERGISPDLAMVLGCGGASRAAVAALREMGVPRIVVSNRTDERAVVLSREFGVEYAPWDERGAVRADLVINSTPIGMSGKFEGLSPLQKYDLRKGMAVFDLVYNPYETRLLADANAAGCETIPGVEMFFHQAVEQFRLWTGEELPREETRALLADALYGAG